MAIDIDKLLGMTKLSLEGEQKQDFAKNLEEKMLLIEESLEWVLIKPRSLEISKVMPLRKDIAKNLVGRELIRKNAPKIEAGCIVVPKLID